MGRWSILLFVAGPDRFLTHLMQSSLALSLLRLIITEGQVYYDGVLTDSINLDALRSKITIIPQVVSTPAPHP